MLYSPLLKDIRVVQRADVGKGEAKRKGGLRRARRAKLYYLRNDNSRLAGIGGVVKRMKEEQARGGGNKGARGGKIRTR
jgi:large subunit ribosomal protein L19